jgi:hypothetical protein
MGISAKGSNCKDGRQADGATAKTALKYASPKQHQLSPNPVVMAIP